MTWFVGCFSVLEEYTILTEDDLKRALYGDEKDSSAGCHCGDVKSDWCQFSAFHETIGAKNTEVIKKKTGKTLLCAAFEGVWHGIVYRKSWGVQTITTTFWLRCLSTPLHASTSWISLYNISDYILTFDKRCVFTYFFLKSLHWRDYFYNSLFLCIQNSTRTSSRNRMEDWKRFGDWTHHLTTVHTVRNRGVRGVLS